MSATMATNLGNVVLHSLWLSLEVMMLPPALLGTNVAMDWVEVDTTVNSGLRIDVVEKKATTDRDCWGRLRGQYHG